MTPGSIVQIGMTSSGRRPCRRRSVAKGCSMDKEDLQTHGDPKACSRCGIVKSLEGFALRGGSPDGHRSDCKSCCAEIARARRAEHPERERQKESKRYEKDREKRLAGCAEWREKNRAQHRAVSAQWSREARYGLPPGGFAAMLAAQDHRCLVCRSLEPGGRGAFHVDHDHACCPGRRSCGKCVRGLLCARCNIAAGLLLDSPEIAFSMARFLSGQTVEPVANDQGPVPISGHEYLPRDRR